MFRNGHCKPRCPDCGEHLKEIRAGKIAVYDLNNQIARVLHRACGMTNLHHLFLKMEAQSITQT